MDTFAQMGFLSQVAGASTNPAADGYIGTLNGLPYNIHPSATPEEWAALEVALAAGLVTVMPYVPPATVTVAPAPDALGFIAACKSAMGGILGANALAQKYPFWLPALQAGDWPDVQALMTTAHAAGDINATQYAAMQAAATANNIPVTLP